MQHAETESYNGKSGWIMTTYGSPQPEKSTIEVPDDVEPADPLTVKKASRWDGEKVIMDETGANTPPQPSDALDKINEYFIQKEGSESAGLGRIDAILGEYASWVQLIRNDNYDLAKTRIDDALDNSNLDLTSTEGSDLKDILDGAL